MPSRSIREMSFKTRSLTALLCLTLSSALAAAEPVIPYQVTEADGFANGRVHGRDAYEGKERGDIDWEPMREVRFREASGPELKVYVVYPSPPPPVYQVVVRPEREVARVGEDKVFDQVRLDVDIQRCIFQNICTEEVKAIPGVYLGDEQSGDDDWTGRGDGALEVITEGPETRPSASSQVDLAPDSALSDQQAPDQKAPGRVFVEEPAR